MTWWTPIRFDYGIGITDVVCIEGVVLDVGKRSGEHASRYLTEYANVGIPYALSHHLLSRIAGSSSFSVSYKRHKMNDRYMWINMNMTEGLQIRRLSLTEGVEGGDRYEEMALRPTSARDLLDGSVRMVTCNLFITLRNSIALSRSVGLQDIPANTPSTVTTKIVACHVTKEPARAKPADIGRAKRL